MPLLTRFALLLSARFYMNGTHTPHEISQLLGDYYPRQLEKLQVRVQLRTEMSAADIKKFGADAVVVGVHRGFGAAVLASQ